MNRRWSVLVMSLIGLAPCLVARHATVSHPDTTSGMDPYVKDLFDVIAKAAGLITVIAGAIGVILQIRKNREERRQEADRLAETRRKEQASRAEGEALRREELRWRKAALAREVIDQISEDQYVLAAMRMLDWDGRSYSGGGETFTVSTAQMHRALRVVDLQFDKREGFVRDCFDAFFDHMQLTEHYLRIGLLELEDVRYPYSYYADLMSKNREIFYRFLKEYKYDYALSFLQRFASWMTG